MFDRFRTLLRRIAWDARIAWRLDNQHLRPFHDAPDEVVERWAAMPDRGQRYEIVKGIAMARDEALQRQHTWRVLATPAEAERMASGRFESLAELRELDEWRAAGKPAQWPAPSPARCACGQGHVGLERSYATNLGVHSERHGAEVCQEGVSGHEPDPPAPDDADPFLQTR